MPHRAGSASLARKLGARIRALRLESGATQESVAWNAGIPKAHLSRIEGGLRLPSLPVLLKLAKELDVEAIDLLGFEMRKARVALLDGARRGDARAVTAALRKLGL